MAAANNAVDPDLWMHITADRLVLKALQVPHVDFFSYSAAGLPWRDHATGDITVTPAPTTSSVGVTPNTQQYSDLVTFSATPTPDQINGIASSASVTFIVGSQVMGTVPLASDGDGNLTATLSNVALVEPVPYGALPIGQMAPGVHTVTAQFNGVNSNFVVSNPTTPGQLPGATEFRRTGGRCGRHEEQLRVQREVQQEQNEPAKQH